MKTFVLALGLSILASNAHAITRYTSTGMECDKVQGTIERDGAAIMRYASTRGTGAQLYGRFVRDTTFCSAGELAERSYIPASDRQQCPVLECKYHSPDDDLLFNDD